MKHLRHATVIAFLITIPAIARAQQTSPSESIRIEGGNITVSVKDMPIRDVVRRVFELSKTKLETGEPLPTMRVDLSLAPAPIDDLLKILGPKVGIFFKFVNTAPWTYRSYNLVGTPAKGYVRVIADDGLRLVVTAAKLKDVFSELEKNGVSAAEIDAALKAQGLDRTAVADWPIEGVSLTGRSNKDLLTKLVSNIRPVDDIVTSVWPLTFTPATLQGSKRPTGRTPEDTADMLNQVFGTKDEPIVTPIGSRLLMRGPRKAVTQARAALAQFIDIPYSQVRLDIWTIQANTSSIRGERQKEGAQRKMDDIRAGVALTRDLVRRLQNSLTEYVIETAIGQSTTYERALAFRPSSRYGTDDPRPLGELMRKAGFDTNPQRPLTIAESMVFLAMLVDSSTITHTNVNLPSAEGLEAGLNAKLSSKLTEFVDEARGELKIIQGQQFVDAERVRRLEGLIQRFERVAEAARARIGKKATSTGRLTADETYFAKQSVFPRLIKSFPYKSRDVILTGLYNFFLNWNECSDHPFDPEHDFPLLLSQSSAGADSMLKTAMDSLHEDVQSLTTQPLMAWIRNEIQRGNARSSGIDLVGTSSLVVTSRQYAELSGTAEGYYPFTPRPKLTMPMLKDAASLSGTASGTSTPKTVTTTTTKTDADGKVTTEVKEEKTRDASSGSLPFGPINLESALLLQALFNETETSYSRVAPGIGIQVVPFVLRDGGSARLQIRVQDAMDVDSVTDPAKQGQPRDRIKSHVIDTDFAVNALDLFELSTFGTDHTSQGDPSWRVPILEQLPLLGPLFNGPRTRVTKHQESLIIIQVSILPKSLDLAGRFIGRLGQ